MPATNDPAGNDGYINIPKGELVRINMTHLATEIDLSIALPADVESPNNNVVTGFTEWCGKWKDSTITIGWDWGYVSGHIVVLNAAEIRTNIRIVVDNGQLAAPPLTRVYLLEWIQGLPWRTVEIPDLIRSTGQPYP